MSPKSTRGDSQLGQQIRLLEGLTALNVGTGLVAAITGKLLADVGVTVRGARAMGHDPAEDLYPAYLPLRSVEQAQLRVEISPSGLRALLADVDICIVGGEDFPDVQPAGELAVQLASEHPKLVVLDIRGYPGSGDQVGRPAVDILVQARSGLVYEHYSDRPNLMSFQPTHFGAALQGVMGVLAATFARGRAADDKSLCPGQVVTTSLYEGALAWVTTWNEAERPDQGFNFIPPLNPRPLIFKCLDGVHVQIILGAFNAKYALYQVLGIDDDDVKPGDAGVPNRKDPPEKFYGDLELLGPYVARWRSADLLSALTKAGVAAMPVLEPGASWDDPQVRHNGLVVGLPDGGEMVGPPIIYSNPGCNAPAKEQPTAIDSMPLAGLRVVDFGAFTAGPLASLFLRKLGADVIKVEPLAGDPARNMPRAFMASNRGKRSICIDMKTPRGRELTARLCSNADVVVSNFRPGVAAKLGIDGQTLLDRHPRLIVLEAPAFGQTGPRASETAFDLVLQAFCGFEARAGGVGNDPLWNRTFLADYGGGQLGAIAVLAALCHRLRSGRGSILDVSLLNGAFLLQSDIVRKPDGSFAGADLLNATQTGFRASECLYPARNGWVALAVRSVDAAKRLCELLRIDKIDISAWRLWGTSEQMAIQAAVKNLGVDEILSACAASGIWAERCMSGMEHITLNDPLLLRLGIVERAPHAQYGLVSQMGSLFRLSRCRLAPPGITPALGLHGPEILREIGCSDAEIEALKSERVIL